MKILPYLVAVCLTFCASAAKADDVATVLVVTFTDETTTTFDLATQPTVSFDATDMIIASESANASYVRSSVKEFHFALQDPVGIQSVQAALNFRYVDGQTIQLSGTASQHAELFDAAGRRIASADSVNGLTTLSLSGLPTGTYIVRAAGQTVKVVKK